MILASSIIAPLMSGVSWHSALVWIWVFSAGGIGVIGLYFVVVSLAGVRWLPLPGFNDRDLPGNRLILLMLTLAACLVAWDISRPGPIPATAALPPQLPLKEATSLLSSELWRIKEDTGDTTRLRLSNTVNALGPLRYPALWAGALEVLERRHTVANVAPVQYLWRLNGIGWSEDEPVDYSFDIVDVAPFASPSPSPVTSHESHK